MDSKSYEAETMPEGSTARKSLATLENTELHGRSVNLQSLFGQRRKV
jgi:hypothetical protein